MPYEIGDANDYIDLLDRVRLFLTNESKMGDQVWQQLRWQEDEEGEYELALKAFGIGGADEIFSSIRTVSTPGDDEFNWQLRGLNGFDTEKSFSEQPGCPGGDYLPTVLLANFAMKYWLVANGQRFVLAVKVSSNYASCYMGFFFPYISKSRLPYPYFFAGDSSHTGLRWSHEGSRHHHGIIRPHHRNADHGDDVLDRDGSNARLFDNQWENIQISREDSGSDGHHWNNYRGLHPMDNDTRDLHSNLRANLDGSYTLFPLIPWMRVPEGRIWGELDGCYWVSGFSNPVENIITVNGYDHVVIQDVYRTNRDDYWALKLE